MNYQLFNPRQVGRGGGGDLLITAKHRVLTKEGVKNGSYLFCDRCATLIVRVGGMPWPKTGVAHYHAKLGLSDNGRAKLIFSVGCYLA